MTAARPQVLGQKPDLALVFVILVFLVQAERSDLIHHGLIPPNGLSPIAKTIEGLGI